MPIRPELRPLYPPHWRELSSHVRFERARRQVPTLWPTTPRPPPLPSGRALVRRASGDMAGSSRTACPLARPHGGNSVSDDARRARSGAPGQRSDQQSAKEPARALSTLPHAAGSAAPFGAALDHLPPALGSRRSLPRPVPGIDRRADKRSSQGLRSSGASPGAGSKSLRQIAAALNGRGLATARGGLSRVRQRERRQRREQVLSHQIVPSFTASAPWESGQLSRFSPCRDASPPPLQSSQTHANAGLARRRWRNSHPAFPVFARAISQMPCDLFEEQLASGQTLAKSRARRGGGATSRRRRSARAEAFSPTKRSLG